jgi:hypothetical protein
MITVTRMPWLLGARGTRLLTTIEKKGGGSNSLPSDNKPSDWLRGLRAHFKNQSQRYIAASEELRAIVGAINELLGPDVEVARNANAQPIPTPGLDAAFLARLPWVPFQDGRGAWIKTAAPGAEKLKQELEKGSGVPIVIGGYKYKFGGAGNIFVNRFSAKVTTTEPVQQ